MRRYNRKFGIEFEFDCSWDKLKKYATKAINKVYGTGKWYAKKDKFESIIKTNKWHIKEESITTSELTTPISNVRDLKRISEVISILKDKGVVADECCGMHIHIDVLDIDQYHLMAGWILCERAIFKCFPKSRRGSSFCERVVGRATLCKNLIAKIVVDKTEGSNCGDAFSLGEYDDRGTVEIRVAEGTTDPDFVIAWVNFLLYWIDAIKKRNPVVISSEKCNSISFEELLEEVNPNKQTVVTMERRYKAYKRVPYWI